MKHFGCIFLIFTLLAVHIYGTPEAQRTRLNAKFLRTSHAARQLAPKPYAAAGQRPDVPFLLPTEQLTESPIAKMKEVTARQMAEAEEGEDEAAGDLAEDVDPIAADAEEDDTEPLPEPETQLRAKSDDADAEEDENADIIPERKAEPTPSKRYWFFRK